MQEHVGATFVAGIKITLFKLGLIIALEIFHKLFC